MKKRLFLSIVVFMLAICGAFAFNYLAPEMGYSKIADVPTQSQPCVARKICDGGPFICRADFIDGGVTYVGIQLYGLETGEDCIVQLTCYQ